MRNTASKIVGVALLVWLPGCAVSPNISVEPPEPFGPAMTFTVEKKSKDHLPGLGVGFSDYVAEYLSDRGWVESAQAPVLTVQYSVAYERVFDVVRGTGPRGISVVSDVRAGADVDLSINVIDTAGVTVWAASEDINVPLGTGREEARAMVLEVLDVILTAIPISDVSNDSV